MNASKSYLYPLPLLTDFLGGGECEELRGCYPPSRPRPRGIKSYMLKSFIPRWNNDNKLTRKTQRRIKRAISLLHIHLRKGKKNTKTTQTIHILQCFPKPLTPVVVRVKWTPTIHKPEPVNLQPDHIPSSIFTLVHLPSAEVKESANP